MNFSCASMIIGPYFFSWQVGSLTDHYECTETELELGSQLN